MHIREYTPDDLSTVAEIYRSAVITLGQQQYSKQQVQAWAQYVDDLEQFATSLAMGLTLCAVIDDCPVAFGQLRPSDHVAYLFCQPEYARRGLASAILQRLEDHARKAGAVRLHTEASRVARPCFEQAGYQVIEAENVTRNQVEFLRYRMEKEL